MQLHRYAIYAPPRAGMPYLSVMVPERGTVLAEGFDNAEEAECHGRYIKSEYDRLVCAA